MSDHAFTLYSHDCDQLETFLREIRKERKGDASISVDVDKDGFVTIYSAGREPLSL